MRELKSKIKWFLFMKHGVIIISKWTISYMQFTSALRGLCYRPCTYIAQRLPLHCRVVRYLIPVLKPKTF